MKIMQFHHFYEDYLNSFYQQRPNLAEAPFAQQLNELLADAFSIGHLLIPYIAELGYETMFTVANCAPLQIAWCKENGITELNPYTWQHDILRHQIESFKPEILYISHPIGFDSRFTRTLNWKPRLIGGWRAGVVPADADFSEFDFMLSSREEGRQTALRHGAKSVAHFLPGFPVELLKRIEDQPVEYDIVFTGGWSRQHLLRNKNIELIAQASDDGSAFKPCFYLLDTKEVPIPPIVQKFNKGERFGLAMFRVIASGKICFNGIGDFQKSAPGNMREFEATGAGALLFTEAHPDLKENFEPEREVVTYSSSEELLEKITYYLEHEEARKEIAKSGQKRCLRDHSMTNRVKWFIDICEDYLKKKSTTQMKRGSLTKGHTKQPELIVNQLINKALDRLKAGSSQEALTIIEQAESYEINVRDLSYVKGICLAELKLYQEAVTALSEEARNFPDNAAAIELLEYLKNLG
ncbi:MAG: hypothetical protein D6719_09415 [Candidatus Dadabacteria bacterium]|nr:MAG: hypothetical protein D6719_09415 [Candidatus Dadabacteria bacterium]